MPVSLVHEAPKGLFGVPGHQPSVSLLSEVFLSPDDSLQGIVHVCVSSSLKCSVSATAAFVLYTLHICVCVFVAYCLLWIPCECKPPSAQLTAAMRKTWIPRASRLFHSHLGSTACSSQQEAHTQTHTHIKNIHRLPIWALTFLKMSKKIFFPLHSVSLEYKRWL